MALDSEDGMGVSACTHSVLLEWGMSEALCCIRAQQR